MKERILNVLVATVGVAPHVLVHADHADAAEPVGIIDRHTPAFGEDGIVDGVPSDPESLGYSGDGQVLHHDAFQRPAQATSRELGPWFGRAAGVLSPHVTAAVAPVSADRNVQRGGPPPEWFVRQPAHDGVARRALAAAASTSLVRFDDTACEDRAVGIEPLAGDFEPELVESTKSGQVNAGDPDQD